MRTIRDFLLVSIVAGSMVTCDNLNLAGGGLDTETSGGTIIGLLASQDGTPEKHASVFCVPSSYNALKDPQLSGPLINTTDDSGHYRFDRVKKGEYNIQAASTDNNTSVLICGINVNSGPVSVPGATLHSSGMLKIIFPDAAGDTSGYCFLPGTTCFTQVRNGSAVISNVPVGFVPAINYFNNTDSTKNHVVKTDFFLSSDDTTVVSDLTPSKFSKKLFLNTSGTGANCNGTVYNFPVLVRLNSANFPFSEAQSTGADIRFTKQNGLPLSYEIEQWDATSQKAAIWVNVDTVFGNDSSHFITMYWGAPAAQSMSNGPAVFDTANGFQGVWHLAETGNTTAKDATGNHYDGTPSDTAPDAAEGMVGQCRSFNGSSNFIRMNGTANSKLNFQENDIYTISAWAYAETLDNTSHLIVGKGNEQYYLKFKSSAPAASFMVWEFVEFHDKVGWDITNSLPLPPSAKTWVYLTGVRKGAAQYLYVNGTLVDSSISVNADNISSVTVDDVTIGRFLSKPPDSIEGTCSFRGMIDEVRISNVAYNADRIKLSYMNQKEQDALVKW
jgi:hypothetical protein